MRVEEMNKKKILVVDNHPVMLQFMESLLVKEGYRVVTAGDGLSALDILRTYIPDVIFVDLVMHNIDGKKLCQVIRGMPGLKDVYIIILSAIAGEQEIDPGELGANTCIVKARFDKMAKYVLSALAQADRGTSAGQQGEIIEVEGVPTLQITKELLSVKRHFEVILRTISEGIIELTPGTRIVYANPAALSLTGIPEEKLLASSFMDLFSDNDQQGIKALLDEVGLAPQKTTQAPPFRLNGKEILLDILPLKNDDHNATIVILSDVSEQKRMETQLRQAHKMEAVGSLAGGIAHDFNNLLMGIQGYTSLMLLDVDPGHSFYEMLTSIMKQAQSGAKLTNQLLGYARKGKYEVKRVDLNRVVKGTSDTFSRTRKEIIVHRELAGDLFSIKGDEGQIEQVLYNLYVNAADAMPGGGHLTLKTENTTYEDIKGRLYKIEPGDYVLLTVTDIGAGMDKKTQGRIFDPFFTTKKMGRGTGLGLASAYGIIKNHRGYIDVNSEKGHGTTFSIYLPASKGAVSQKRSAVKHEETKQGKETILLVDDEQTVRKVTRALLERTGYRVLTARNGEDAIKLYRKKRDRIDMVLLDMIMPNMGGAETYDRLKEINPNIRVLLSSGYSINGQAVQILEQGCDGFVQKPFGIAKLSQSIRKVLDKK
jgi:two-component system cell cycle sensor histidine kinase/response regulator CckA